MQDWLQIYQERNMWTFYNNYCNKKVSFGI